MTQNTNRYRTYVTHTGFGLEALANQQGTKVDFAKLVVGDGELPDSSNPADQTKLINQIRHYPVTIELDDKDPTIWVARAEIPADDGGFTIREAGVKVTDENGDLYCYARHPGDYKPVLEEGSAKSYTIRLKFIPGNASVIEAKIDPSVQFATPTDLSNAVKEHMALSQFLPYDATRKYKTGEICYTKDQTGELSYWQWYSNVESLAGKNPLNDVNRQSGWTDDTKPFYWSPYKKARTGTPLFPWMSMTFPEGTLNVLGNSVPVAVFWRLAAALPEFVNSETGMINFPETGGEFFRVLDQGRGIDPNRTFASWQKGSAQIINDRYEGHVMGIEANNQNNSDGIRISAGLDNALYSDYNNIRGVWTGHNGTSNDFMHTNGWGGGTSRPRNLAFPILIEV
jgi:phage-related tail fiber protein